AICFVYLIGELPPRRLRAAVAAQALVTCWTAAFTLVLLRLCFSWQTTTCRQVEKKQDLLCSSAVKATPLVAEMACLFETVVECEFMFLLVCGYALNALLSLLGSVLAAYGVWNLQERAPKEQMLCMPGSEALHESGVFKPGLPAKWHQAAEVLLGLRLARIAVDVAACTTVLSACRKCLEWQRALRLWADASTFVLGEELDVVAYNAAISICAGGSLWQEAIALLGDLQAKKLQSSVVSYSAAISSCEKSSQWHPALELLSELRQSRLQLNVIVLTIRRKV
ncbi:unnamed protein product, partial [Symbiodinium sp. KB8]